MATITRIYEPFGNLFQGYDLIDYKFNTLEELKAWVDEIWYDETVGTYTLRHLIGLLNRGILENHERCFLGWYRKYPRKGFKRVSK